MFKVVKKEVIGNIEGLAVKTQKFSIKLVAFVISCWLIVGTVLVVVPVHGGHHGSR